MKKIRWMDSFTMGIPQIDDDHRLLVEKIAALQDALEAVDYPACCRQVREFVVLAGKHFASEEAFLRRSGYPDVSEHKVAHDVLLLKGREAVALCDDRGSPEKIEASVVELVHMLIGDIIKADVEFKSFLQEKSNVR